MLIALIIFAIFSTILARIFPKRDATLAWLLGIILAYLAGTRTGGADYDEYVTLINYVRFLGDENIFLRIAAAKDPIFLLFIDLATWISKGPEAVFLLVAVASVASKVYATTILRGRRTFFITTYAIFLAPGLEFAAIRAGLAVGLVMLAIVTLRKWRIFWFLLGVASHLSVLVISFGRLLRSGIGSPIVVIFGIILVTPYLMSLGRQDPRFNAYFENPGTFNALIPPILTLAALLILGRANRNRTNTNSIVTQDLFAASLACVLVSIALALPSVTVSFRTLEIAWVLILFEMVVRNIGGRKPQIRVELNVAWGMMLVIWSASNILRNTWQAMLSAPGNFKNFL